MREIKTEEDPFLHEKFLGGKTKKDQHRGVSLRRGRDTAVLTHAGLLSEKTLPVDQAQPACHCVHGHHSVL